VRHLTAPISRKVKHNDDKITEGVFFMRNLSDCQKWILAHTDDVISVDEIMAGYFGIKRDPDGRWEDDSKKRINARTQLGHTLQFMKERELVRYVRPGRNITGVILTEDALKIRAELLGRKEGAAE
jgi:hypothetical protein